MRISSLQQYILLKIAEKGGKIDRKLFRDFYADKKDKVASKKYQEKIITQSLERLIDRGFITGHGKRTPQKWFVTHVSLTAKGKNVVNEIHHRRQKKLPLK